MSRSVHPREAEGILMEGHTSYRLLEERHGCVHGCCTGISVYTTTEYPAANSHADQEGFVVLAGSGWAMVGGEEFRLEPEVSFLAPAGVPHCLRSDSKTVPVKVFWFHAAI